jgi:hypothetical protein
MNATSDYQIRTKLKGRTFPLLPELQFIATMQRHKNVGTDSEELH